MSEIRKPPFWKNTLSAALLATSVGMVSGRDTLPDEFGQEQVYSARKESLDMTLAKIKAFEENMGDRELTFEDATQYIPLVAQLYTSSIDATMTADELTNLTYIVRRQKNGTGADASSHPSVRLFLQDYPGIPMSESMEKAIAETSEKYGGMSLYEEEKVLLVIGSEDHSQPDLFQQYTGEGYQVECEQEKPIVVARSRLLHEYLHIDTFEEFKPLDDRVARAYFQRWGSTTPLEERETFIEGVPKKVFVQFMQDDPTTEASYAWGGLQSNFSFFYSSRSVNETDMKTRYLDGFGEFVHDYLSTQISIRHNLPYIISAHAKPDVYANFKSLLTQADITDADLLLMYQNSQLVPFYLRIADSAENIQFGSDDEKLQFGFRMIDPAASVFSFSGIHFGQYFSDVSLEDYRYIDPATYDQRYQDEPNKPLLGCVR